MSNDSSSSEEELEKFKEAIDERFFPGCNTETGGSNEKDQSLVKPSLRNQPSQAVSINPFTIKVTPEFQKHVSKRLSKLLDNSIDDSEILFKKVKKHKKQLNCGVKLFHSSKDYLTLPSEQINLKPNGYKRRDYLDEIDFEERAKEVAVSPEWVLSKEETKHWAPNTRGEVEILKVSGLQKKNLKRKRVDLLQAKEPEFCKNIN